MDSTTLPYGNNPQCSPHPCHFCPPFASRNAEPSEGLRTGTTSPYSLPPLKQQPTRTVPWAEKQSVPASSQPARWLARRHVASGCRLAVLRREAVPNGTHHCSQASPTEMASAAHCVLVQAPCRSHPNSGTNLPKPPLYPYPHSPLKNDAQDAITMRYPLLRYPSTQRTSPRKAQEWKRTMSLKSCFYSTNQPTFYPLPHPAQNYFNDGYASRVLYLSRMALKNICQNYR